MGKPASPRQLSLRGIFFILLTTATLPLGILLVSNLISMQQTRESGVRQRHRQAALLIANRIGETVEASRQFLTVLVHTPDINALDAARAKRLLNELSPHYPFYANIGLALGSGLNLATSIATKAPIDSSGQPWFRRLQTERGFTVGDYQIGRATGKPGINFALPLPNQAAAPALAAVYVAITLDELDHSLASIELDPGSEILLLDAGHTILGSSPTDAAPRGLRWVAPEQPGDNAAAEYNARGPDGVERTYQAISVPGSKNQLTVLAGFSLAALSQGASADYWTSLLLYGGVIALTLGLAAWMGNRRLVKPLVDLAKQVQRMGQGDFSMVVGRGSSLREVDSLQSSFARMLDYLQHNLHLTQAWIDSIPIPVYRKDRQGRFLACNKAFAAFWNRPIESIIGLSSADLGDPRFAGLQTGTDAAVLARKGGTQSFESDVRRPDGSVCAIIVTKTAYTGEDGQVMGSLGVYMDITERKAHLGEVLRLNQQLEDTVRERTARLQAANASLLETQGMLSLVLDSIPIRVFWKDREGRYLGCNQAFAFDLGLASPSLVVGRTDQELPWESDPGQLQAGDEELLWTDLPQLGLELSLTLPGQGERTILISKVPLHDNEKRLVGLLAAYDDISARKQAQAELIMAKEAAESANQAKSSFLANMSHEIRTPMNAILGFSDLLSKHITDPRQAEYLAAIRSSGRTLLSLINDILDLSKIEAGRMEIQNSLLKPRELINEMVMIFQPRCQDKGLALDCRIDDSVPDGVLQDGLRMRQILFNLLGNAVKFTAVGGITIEARAEALDDSGGIELSIAVVDTGIGIPEEQQALIFEPFRQQDGQNHAQYGGTGLGLTISQRLARMMGGEITVESRPGAGSSFCLTLPSKNHSEADEPDESDKHPGELPAFEPCQVLVVDDVAANRTLLAAMLELPGIKVWQAGDGLEALESIRKHRPDLVLMDIRMPRMDGFAAIKAIRADPALNALPVIAVTASVFNASEESIRASGFDGYLRKPIRMRELNQFLRRHLPLDPNASPQSGPTAPSEPAAIPGEPMPVQAFPDALLGELTATVLPLCQRLKTRLFLNEIRSLLNLVFGLADQYNNENLERWCQSLNHHLDDYNTNAITQSLNQLADMILGAGPASGQPGTTAGGAP